jgi:hypothetical protein
MALTTVGTLALLSAALSRRLPADDGRTRMRASRSATAWGSRTPGRTGGALLLGIPVYLGQRRHMSQPAPVPPYRDVERGG